MAVAFVKYCCNREVQPWRVSEGKELLGELVREMLIEAVE